LPAFLQLPGGGSTTLLIGWSLVWFVLVLCLFTVFATLYFDPAGWEVWSLPASMSKRRVLSCLLLHYNFSLVAVRPGFCPFFLLWSSILLAFFV
jgi:hypothetical protein